MNETPWDAAMDAIAAEGCGCEATEIEDHTCRAGRCEYALRAERAEVERLRGERDGARDVAGRLVGFLVRSGVALPRDARSYIDAIPEEWGR